MPAASTSPSGEPARIAVIIPCFRDGEFVPKAIDSVQEDEAVEIVVVDDASDDVATSAVLDRLAHEGVTVIRQGANGGPGVSRNAGLEASSAPFVFPLDADDLAVAGALGRMADTLESRPQAAVCVGDYLEFGDSELMRAVPDRLDPYRVAYTNEYPISALFRRTALEAAGGWTTNVRGYEDWSLWMTLAERGETAAHLGPGSPTYRRRLHGERMLTGAKNAHSEYYAQLRRAHPRLFADLPAHRRRSSLSPLRKALYPLVYGGRTRHSWEPRVKALLDRSGVWTLRRPG